MKDLSAHKLDLISYLVNLTDESILNELAAVMVKHKNGIGSGSLSKEDIVERALRSNHDYETGKYLMQEQLELDSEKW